MPFMEYNMQLLMNSPTPFPTSLPGSATRPNLFSLGTFSLCQLRKDLHLCGQRGNTCQVARSGAWRNVAKIPPEADGALKGHVSNACCGPNHLPPAPGSQCRRKALQAPRAGADQHAAPGPRTVGYQVPERRVHLSRTPHTLPRARTARAAPAGRDRPGRWSCRTSPWPRRRAERCRSPRSQRR